METQEPLRLDIGAGDTPVEGFIPVDRKNGKEAYPLDYPDGTVDEIRASHVLEHFPTAEVNAVLEDWVRVLKPGGKMRIAVPDFEFIADAYHHGRIDPSMLFGYAMGGQTDENDFHKCAFDESRLRGVMEYVGLRQVGPWESEVDDCAGLPVSLNLEGTKPIPRAPVDIPAMIGIMSTNKIGFTENLFCAMQVLQPRGVELFKHTGVFWGQCLERVMADAIAQGAEWLVTLDFDTVFTPQAFEELCYLMATHPEVDAIAPWQVKRECDEPLVWMKGWERDKPKTAPLSDFDGDLTQVETAHFGLTLLRVSAIKKLTHPYFLAKPNADGEWGEGRVDEDIYFWHRWQEAGNTLHMANHVSIGHLQQMASWPDQYLRPVHQYVTDFQKQGQPAEARR